MKDFVGGLIVGFLLGLAISDKAEEWIWLKFLKELAKPAILILALGLFEKVVFGQFR